MVTAGLVAAIGANFTFTAWLTVMWIETETTQGIVEKTLESHNDRIQHIGEEHSDMHNRIDQLPLMYTDRYRGVDALRDQNSQLKVDDVQNGRIKDLEEMHLFRHNLNRHSEREGYNRRSNDN